MGRPQFSITSLAPRPMGRSRGPRPCWPPTETSTGRPSGAAPLRGARPSEWRRPGAALIANGRVMDGTTASGGASGQGTVFRLTLDGPPSPPTTVSVAQAVRGRVHLNWASVATTSTYVVKRGLSPGHETVLIAGLGSNSFVDATVTTGATYYYVVSAVNASGSSVASYEVSITVGRGAAAD